MAEKYICEKLGAGFWLSVGWIVIVMIGAVSADLFPLPGYDHMDWGSSSAPPGTHGRITTYDDDGRKTATPFVYIFGADAMGRDILTRLIYGARVSLTVGLTAPLIGLIIGLTLGMSAGFYQGVVESVIMWIMDVILAFPGLVFLLVVTFYLGSGLSNMIFALGFLTIPAFTRVARANTLAYAQREFVIAAKALGQSEVHILVFEILPNIVIPMMVYALLVVSYMIMAEGALSFLGLGVPPPTPSWGKMIAEGKEVLDNAVHVSLMPAMVMFLTVLSFNVMGDAVRGLIDSKKGQI